MDNRKKIMKKLVMSRRLKQKLCIFLRNIDKFLTYISHTFLNFLIIATCCKYKQTNAKKKKKI